MQTAYQLSDIAPTLAQGPIVALLTAAGHKVRFAEGEAIQLRGDSGNGFWMVESGQVTVCRHGEDGTLTIYAVLGPGNLFGELACFAGVSRQVDALATSAAVLRWVSTPQVDHLLASEPAFARWLLQSLAGQLRTALDRIESDRALDASARLTRTLVELARRDGPDLAITQQQLADLVGVSRVTCGQVLARLGRAGLVERGYGRITVANPSALEALA